MTLKSRDALQRHPPLRRAVDEAGAGQGPKRGEREIVQDAHRPHQALGAAIFRHVGDALCARGLGRVDPHAFAVEADLAGLARRHAEQGLREFAAAGAHEPRKADDLARAHGEADALGHRPAHEIARLEHRRADRRDGLGEEALDPPPDHHLHEFADVGVGDVARADIGAVAQHGDAIGDRENLVEAMADIDDPDAALLEAAHDVEQPRHVAFGQRRGRLVHDEDARVMRQRAQDLDALAVADGERADDLIGSEIVDFERVEQRLGFGAHRPPIDAARARLRRVAEKDVLGDAELGKQQQLLIDRRDARAARVVGRGKVNLFPVDKDRADVGLVDAGHDLDQRRFAGAVLSEQRMDLARAHVERDARKRAHAGK